MAVPLVNPRRTTVACLDAHVAGRDTAPFRPHLANFVRVVAKLAVRECVDHIFRKAAVCRDGAAVPRVTPIDPLKHLTARDLIDQSTVVSRLLSSRAEEHTVSRIDVKNATHRPAGRCAASMRGLSGEMSSDTVEG